MKIALGMNDRWENSSKYSGRNQNAPQEHLDQLGEVFKKTIDVFIAALNSRPFRLTSALNVAVYDSCMIGMATRLANSSKPAPSPEKAARNTRRYLRTPAMLRLYLALQPTMRLSKGVF
jgi:hypothetical protein